MARALKLSRRQQAIIEAVQREGFVSVEDLAIEFGVTSQTIRRDINFLGAQSLLRRYHGGAAIPSSSVNLPYDRRKVLSLSEKQSIAASLVEDIPEQSSLAIDIGTTPEEVARALLGHHRLRVVTANLNVALILAAKPQIEVLVAGGVLRTSDQSVVGDIALDTLNRFKVDVGIISCSGIDSDGTLLDFDMRKVELSRAIVRNSRQIYLAADHSKFTRTAMVRSINIGQVSRFYSDRKPPEEIEALLEKQGVEMVIAGKTLSPKA